MGTTPQNSIQGSTRRKDIRTNSWGVSLQNSMIWCGTQGNHTNHGGYKAILPMSRQETNLFKSTQGATYIIKKVGSQYINIILSQVQNRLIDLMGN